MDDDNYVNVRMLVKLLSSYPHTQDIYIGKPSLDRPIQATERISENKMVSVGRVWGWPSLGWVEKELLSHSVGSPLAASCAFLVCHGRSGVLYQPGAGTEDEPLGQVRALVLLSHGDSSWSSGRQRGDIFGDGCWTTSHHLSLFAVLGMSAGSLATSWEGLQFPQTDF